ncbi:S8 family serine peptidase [Bifidobacterium leontopitheci]|nr:S8 family serine peptidase [Bifidobacterium leontopitheci]
MASSHLSMRRRIAAALCSTAFTLSLCALSLGSAALPHIGPDTAKAADGSCEIGKSNYITQTPWTESVLGMDTVRDLADGDGVIVAVVDSGVDTNNPHLAGTAVLPGVNLAGDGAADGRTDNYGHGTVVAGIIAARQIDGSSLVGIAPKATILPVRVYSAISNTSSHSQGGPSTQTLAEGIRYAADHNAQIINVSQSTVNDSGTLQAAVTYAQSKGSLVVASAGNRNTSSDTRDGLRYPAAWPDVLGVGAADTSFHTSADSIEGPQVDILAPGMAVTSTIPKGVDCVFSTDAAATSYATAYASGVAALVAQRHPDESASQWLQRIEASGNRPDPDARDNARGWGMINPYGAITMTLANGMRGPSSSSYEAYTPEQTPRQHLRIRQAGDADAGIVTLMTVLGVAVAIIVIVLVTVKITADSRKRAEAEAREREKIRPTPAGKGRRHR